MNNDSQDTLNEERSKRIKELEAENARLRAFMEKVKALWNPDISDNTGRMYLDDSQYQMIAAAIKALEENK